MVDGSVEKKWDTVIPADLKRLFVSGTYICPAGHERVNMIPHCRIIFVHYFLVYFIFFTSYSKFFLVDYSEIDFWNL